MSAISSISANLYQYSQNLSATTQAPATSAAAATTAATATAGATSTDGTTSGQPVQGHRHHHHGGHSGAGANSQLFQQVQQAVTSALQSSSQSGTNPNQAVEDAITKVLQNNTSAVPQTPNGAAQANTSASTASQRTTGAPGTPGTSSLQAFFQTLQSAGINPQQFQQDFASAVQNAQNGNADASTAFKSFPPGSVVDTFG